MQRRIPHSSLDVGFTLVETLVCLAILSVLVALAAPSFGTAIAKLKIRSVHEELVASVSLAKTQAIRLRRPVLIRRLTDCAASSTNHKDWSCGWELVIDANRNQRYDAHEPVLQTFHMPGGISFVRGQNSEQVVVTHWGSTVPLAERFVITPRDLRSDALAVTLCMGSGGRLRAVYGQTGCGT